MPTLSSYMKFGKSFTLSGFTLVEMIISVAITTIIIGGSTYFILKTNSEIQSTKNQTKIHIEITSFMEKMNYIRTNYSSGIILIQNSNNYDVVLYMNSGATAGVLIGVVNTAHLNTNGEAKLDLVSNYNQYESKSIGIQELTKIQLDDLVNTPNNAYNIFFQSDTYYPNLIPKKFSVTPYNSGSLLEFDIDIYERFISELNGSDLSKVSDETSLPFTLIF